MGLKFLPKTPNERNATKAFLIGEATQIVVTPGVVLFCDKVAPGLMESMGNFIADHFIEPRLEFFERAMKTRPKDAEIAPGTAPDPIERRDRARKVGYTFIRFALPAVIVAGINVLVQHKAEQYYKVVTEKKLLQRSLDLGTQIATSIAMPTLFSSFSKKLEEKATNASRKAGLSESSCESVGFSTPYVALPELAGAAVGLLTMLNVGFGGRQR